MTSAERSGGDNISASWLPLLHRQVLNGAKRTNSRTLACLLIVVVLATIYVGNTWTPSSYAIVLKSIGASDATPQLGTPREVRWDEYLVLTPLFQIVLRNQFHRYNELSPYHEDLKNFYALPILDWSLAFKPQLWAFMVAPPAYAYSFYHFVLLLSFIVGFAIFLRQLGATAAVSVAAAFVLFFAHFTQVWWSTNAPTFAFAPWIGILFLTKWKWQFRLPTLIYLTTLWLFSLLYPPFIIGAVFAMGVLIIAFRPDRLRPANIALSALAGFASLLLVWSYYGDVFEIMRNTEYPGRRELVGGTVPWYMIVAHVFPFLNILEFEPLRSGAFVNACEIAVVGTLLPLSFLIFIDYRHLRRWAHEHRWPAMILPLGLAMTLTWMIFPLPAWTVKWLLWNFVPPIRLSWSTGLILTFGLAVIASHVPWRINLTRLAAFIAAIFSAWLVSKYVFVEFLYPRSDLSSSGALARSWMDWIAFVPFLIVLFAIRTIQHGRMAAAVRSPAVLLGIIAATGAITFGTFNPLQSARPIFSPPETNYLKALRQMASVHPKGYVAVERVAGATLNGLGIPAINHVLLRPQLLFFRTYFPDLPEKAFNQVFNRYGQIIPSIEPNIHLLQPDAIRVPIERFGLNIPVRIEQSAQIPPRETPWRSQVELASFTKLAPKRWQIVIRGWAPFAGFSPDQRLHVQLASSVGPLTTVRTAVAIRLPRPDVASYFAREDLALAGFVLRLELDVHADTQDAPREAIDIWASDPQLGAHQISWK